MSVLGECLGSGHEFRDGDQTYHVRLIDQDAKDAFEKKLFGWAQEAARGMRGLMSPAEYAAHLKALNDDFVAGEYGLISERGQAALKTVKGLVALCAILFGVSEDAMLALLLRRKEEVQALIALVLQESFPDVLPAAAPAGGREKNAPAPAATVPAG